MELFLTSQVLKVLTIRNLFKTHYLILFRNYKFPVGDNKEIYFDICKFTNMKCGKEDSFANLFDTTNKTTCKTLTGHNEDNITYSLVDSNNN